MPGQAQPPAPPEGAIPVEVEIIRSSKLTKAQRLEHGASISFVVLNGGIPEQHTYMIGEKGKSVILEELMGGLKVPGR